VTFREHFFRCLAIKTTISLYSMLMDA
jgi:hypothetical protein